MLTPRVVPHGVNGGEVMAFLAQTIYSAAH
jgi:hypothetical protein